MLTITKHKHFMYYYLYATLVLHHFSTLPNPKVFIPFIHLLLSISENRNKTKSLLIKGTANEKNKMERIQSY